MDTPTLHDASEALANADIQIEATEEEDAFCVVLFHEKGGPHYRSGPYSRAEAEAIVRFLKRFRDRDRWSDAERRALMDASDR